MGEEKEFDVEVDFYYYTFVKVKAKNEFDAKLMVNNMEIKDVMKLATFNGDRPYQNFIVKEAEESEVINEAND